MTLQFAWEYQDVCSYLARWKSLLRIQGLSFKICCMRIPSGKRRSRHWPLGHQVHVPSMWNVIILMNQSANFQMCVSTGGCSYTSPAALANGMLPTPQLLGVPVLLGFWVIYTIRPFGINQFSHLGFVVDLLQCPVRNRCSNPPAWNRLV